MMGRIIHKAPPEIFEQRVNVMTGALGQQEDKHAIRREGRCDRLDQHCTPRLG